MSDSFDLSVHGLSARAVLRNVTPAILYEDAITRDKETVVSSGALRSSSGAKTGRSPKDQRIVNHPNRAPHVDWGEINIPLDEHTFRINHRRAIASLDPRKPVYVVDGYAGWDP